MEEKIVHNNVFKYKNYTLAFLGMLVSNLGSILYNFAVSFYILELSENNAFLQGTYLAVSGIVYMISVLFGGVFGDRFNKSKIMYICDYFKGGLILIAALLLMLILKDANSQIVILFIMAVGTNVISGFFTPASASLLPQIVPEELFQQGQSYYSAVGSLLGIIGVVLAAILYAYIPIDVFFIAVGLCYVASGVSEMFIKYNYVKKEDRLTLKGAFKDMGDGLKYLFTFKSILALMGCILFVNFFFSPIGSNFIPYFIKTDVAASDYMFKSFLKPEMWSSVLSVVSAIGMIASASFLSTRKKQEHISKGLRISFTILVFSLVLMTISYFLFKEDVYNINTILIMFSVGNLIVGVLIGFINIPVSTTVLTIVDNDKIGKVQSVIDIGSQGLIPISEFLAGVIISSFGSGWLLVACTLGFAVITGFILFNKHISEL